MKTDIQIKVLLQVKKKESVIVLNLQLLLICAITTVQT